MVSHHQLPLAKELCKLVGEDNFIFAAMGRPDEDRLKNGWKGEYAESWIIHPNESLEEKVRFDKFWDEADIVLCGERLISKMQERVDQNKICFYMSERWFKPPLGVLRLCHPAYFKMVLDFRKLSKSEFFHYLPTGPFAAKDMALIAPMEGRVWQWGYFTEMPSVIRDFTERPDDVVSILWVGRMLKLKRVDLLINALHRLKSEGKLFRLTLVGEGPERERLQRLSDKLLGKEYCTIQGFIPSEEVTALMAKHDVYVLPSNAYEGWGAVVNEAMSVGCAVVVSDKTGAGASLINHGVNGLLFKSGSVDSLYKFLSKVVHNKELNQDLGIKAIATVIEAWQPAIVAERFVALVSVMLNERESVVGIECTGPLSALNYINNW